MKVTSEEATITFGEGVVTLRRKGSSQAIVANILGVVSGGKEQSFYLDRLIHKPHETELASYAVHGAKTTILALSTPR
jgi:hypothetical protein